MNRFLRRIFWFVLPVAAAAAGAEWGLRCIPHQLGYKAAYMERHAPEIEVLSLGLSHAFYGLDFHASKFRGFNLAYHGQPLDRDLELWEKYADRLTSLRAVVISLSCWSTHHRLRKEGEQWRVPFYTINYDLPGPWYAFKERYIIAYPSPAFRYLKHALSPGDIRAEGNTPQDEFGSYMALCDNRRPDWDRRTAGDIRISTPKTWPTTAKCCGASPPTVRPAASGWCSTPRRRGRPITNTSRRRSWPSRGRSERRWPGSFPTCAMRTC